MVRHAAARASAKRILTPNILPLCEGATRIETAAGKHHLSVESHLRVFERIDLDHAAIFRPYSAGIPRCRCSRIAHRPLHLGAEARRAIVCERMPSTTNCVWYSERVGAGPHCLHIAAGLRIYQILQGASWKRADRFWIPSKPI